MTATFELESPEATAALVEQIKAKFTGRLRVTVSTVEHLRSAPTPHRSLFELMNDAPSMPGFVPLTRDEIYADRNA